MTAVRSVPVESEVDMNTEHAPTTGLYLNILCSAAQGVFNMKREED